MQLYCSVDGLQYASRESGSFPSSLMMACRAARSISDRETEKFKYLQPKTIGGQAGRIWTSLALHLYSKSTVSLICVPRTIESSQKSSRLPETSSGMGISF